jgi:hypothetical protein
MTKSLLPRLCTGARSARALGLLSAALAAGVVALGCVMGCVVEAVNPRPAGMPVAGPPPEPMREVHPTAASPRAFWVAGYWHWTGMQYTWIPGHWEEPPPGARWQAPHYSLHDGTYFYEPPRWTVRP